MTRDVIIGIALAVFVYAALIAVVVWLIMRLSRVFQDSESRGGKL